LFCSHWKPNDYMRMYGIKAYNKWRKNETWKSSVG
jgi:hypothetical protein